MRSPALWQLAKRAFHAPAETCSATHQLTLAALAPAARPHAHCGGASAFASTSQPGSCRWYSHPAKSSAPIPGDSDGQARPVGKGYGFRERFKDMKTVYLRQLLAKSSDPQRRARMRLLPPPVPSQQGEHALQYERTGTVITKQYRLKPRNIFAVVEAGHGQFKGALPLSATDSGWVQRLSEMLQSERSL